MPSARKAVLTAIATVSVLALVAVAVQLVTARQQAKAAEARVRAASRQIEALERIATAEYVYRNVIYAAQDRRILGRLPTGSTEVLFSLSIRVQAGIDLARGYTVVPDRDNPTRAFVTLPQPTVFFVDADETTIEEYFAQERLLMRIDWLDLGREIEEQKAAARSDAIERGLFTRARSNAVVVVEELLLQAGFSSVEITFSTDEELRG